MTSQSYDMASILARLRDNCSLNRGVFSVKGVKRLVNGDWSFPQKRKGGKRVICGIYSCQSINDTGLVRLPLTTPFSSFSLLRKIPNFINPTLSRYLEVIT